MIEKLNALKNVITPDNSIYDLKYEYYTEEQFVSLNTNNKIAIIEYGPFQKLRNKNLKDVPYIFIQINTYNNKNYAEVWSSESEIIYIKFDDMMVSSNRDDYFFGFNNDTGCNIKDISENIYETILSITEALHLNITRIWNMIPNVIGIEQNNEERYKNYCCGRAISFSKHKSIYPSATGIGINGNNICVYLLATANKKTVSIENPRQTPAYKYPQTYGIRSPSFARATYAYTDINKGSGNLYISGTASIIGSETVHIGDIQNQTVTTIENIAALISEANLKKNQISNGFGIEQLNYVKVYIKNIKQKDIVINLCEKYFLTKNIMYMITDMCRPDLLVEIEGIILNNT